MIVWKIKPCQSHGDVADIFNVPELGVAKT